MAKRLLSGLALAGAISLLMWWFLFGIPNASQSVQEQTVVGRQERVILLTPNGEVQVAAKIDTGADSSSLDLQFARSLGFEPSGRKVGIVTDRGIEERDTAQVPFFLAGRRISTLVTLADRTNLSTPMIIGRASLRGLIVDPSREFLTEPRPQSGAPVALPPAAVSTPVVDSSRALIAGPVQQTEPPAPPAFTVFGIESDRLNKTVLVIPLLGFPVVLIRLLGGVRTYGIFAPVVVALSLIDLDIVPGLLVYLFLVSLGIGAKLLVLDRLQLPNIAELSLLLAILVVGLLAVSALPISFPFTFSETFFRLIITTFIIEQASRAAEDNRTRDMIPMLGATFAIAVLLTFYGSFLLRQSFAALWALFAVSLVAVILSSNYLGLRLTEFVRFKFLKRTHVH